MTTPQNGNNGAENASMLSEILGIPSGTPGVSSVSSSGQTPASPASPVSSNSVPPAPPVTLGDLMANSASGGGDTPPPLPPEKPKKPPMKPIDFLKLIGAILVVSLIFFGSFLAYIVFNPGEAVFFRSLGINPGSIAELLSRLVNAVFGSLTFGLSVVWIIFLFRWILTKKENRKKKVTSLILAIFFWVLLFSNLGLWSFLMKQIGISDYANPNGGVVIYDNDRFLSGQFTDSSELQESDLASLIGPVTIRFDLKSDAKFASKTLNIESYEIDFDGNGTIDKDLWDIANGANPERANNLTFTYSKKGTFKPKGKYIGVDNISKESKTIDISFPPITIAGTVDIRRNLAKKAVTFDATSLSSLGKPEWYESSNLDTPASTEALYSSRMADKEKFVCLVLTKGIKPVSTSCDKIFMIDGTSDEAVAWEIAIEKDPLDPLSYTFSLSGARVKDGGEIESYSWSLDNGNVISTSEKPEYTFNDYRKSVRITVRLTDSAGRKSIIESPAFDVAKPLSLMRGDNGQPLLHVTDDTGKDIIASTYNKSMNAYYIRDLSVPTKIALDGRDVRIANTAGYELKDIDWDIDGAQKTGNQATYELIEEKRVTITATYHFLNQAGEIADVVEKIVLEGKKKDLTAAFKITQDSDYAPAYIKFDGSISTTKNGTIQKFIYDFGTQKPAAEWDAIQTYLYDTPGEYKVKLTVVKDDGSKAITERTVIVKATPKNIEIATSVSSATVGKGLDFSAVANGQIDSYLWDFKDGTETSIEANPTHTFTTAGIYKVSLTVRYLDGTVRIVERNIEAKDGNN